MGILNLPLEIFRIILVEAVLVRGLKRALRLRLVNKLFLEELFEALCASKLIDKCYLHKSNWLWVKTYFEKRLRERRTEALPRLHTIRKIAEILAIEDGADSNYESYTEQLLQLVFTSGRRKRKLLFGTQLLRGEESFSFDLLTAAAFTNHILIVTTLVDTNLRTGEGLFGSPLEAAAKSGNSNILNLLIGKLKNPKYSLLQVINNGDQQMVRYLLDSEECHSDIWFGPIQPHTEENTRIKFCQKMLFLRTPNVEILDVVLSELRTRGLGRLDDDLLRGLLYYAIKYGWTDMVHHLISLGSPIDNSKFGILSDPLYQSCNEGHAEIVQALLDNGACPRGVVFTVATIHGHTMVIKSLLVHTEAGLWLRGTNCLYLAARKGFRDIVELLLNSGVDPNSGEPAALIGAVESEHVEIFRLLVRRGATVSRILPEAKKRAEAEGLESMLAFLQEYAQLPSE